MAKPKHRAVISLAAAGCECGRMRVLIRPDNEAVGVFTLRAWKAWLVHDADPEDGQQIGMFGGMESEAPAMDGGLFG